MLSKIFKPKQNTIKDYVSEIRAAIQSANKQNFTSALWSNFSNIDSYLRGFELSNSDMNLTNKYVSDALPRFLKTLEFIPLKGQLNILELGANPYFFSLLIKKFFDHKVSYANFFAENVYETKTTSLEQSIKNLNTNETFTFKSSIFNLEKTSPYPYEKDNFDIVLCCEILEHLVLNPFNIFPEILNILKPGGILILTTPNAVRLTNVAAMLAGENFFDIFHPVIHGRHNREYSIAELKKIVKEHDYKLELAETHDRFNYDQIGIYATNYSKPKQIPYTKKSLNDLLASQNQPLEHRGDNIYLVAAKK